MFILGVHWFTPKKAKSSAPNTNKSKFFTCILFNGQNLCLMRSHMVLYEYLCWTFLLNLISSSTGGIGRLQGLFLFLAVAFDSLQVFPIFFSILFKVKYAMYFFAIPSFDVLVGSNQKHCCNFFLKSVLPISSSISMGC